MPTCWVILQRTRFRVPFLILASGPRTLLPFTSTLLLRIFSLSLTGGPATVWPVTFSLLGCLPLCWEAYQSQTSVWVNAALRGLFITHFGISMVLATTQLSWLLRQGSANSDACQHGVGPVFLTSLVPGVSPSIKWKQLASCLVPGSSCPCLRMVSLPIPSLLSTYTTVSCFLSMTQMTD